MKFSKRIVGIPKTKSPWDIKTDSLLRELASSRCREKEITRVLDRNTELLQRARAKCAAPRRGRKPRAEAYENSPL